jgi:peptidoglycan/LPS O-acetylase OafA/YrhL
MLFFNAMVGRFAFLRMLSCFLVGVVVFKTWQLSAKRMEKWAGALTLVASLGMLVAGFVWQVEVLMNVFLATLLYGLAFQKGPIAKLLASRVAVYLGTISFPLYVMHDVPLLWVQYFVSTHSPVCSTAQTLALVAAWVVGTVCLATVLHYTVEKPSHMWGRKWAGREVRTSREAVPALSSLVTAWDAQLASSGYRERSLPVATGRFTRMPATHNFQTSPHDTSMAR